MSGNITNLMSKFGNNSVGVAPTEDVEGMHNADIELENAIQEIVENASNEDNNVNNERHSKDVLALAMRRLSVRNNLNTDERRIENDRKATKESIDEIKVKNNDAYTLKIETNIKCNNINAYPDDLNISDEEQNLAFTYEDTKLYRLIKPLIISLKIGGLFFYPNYKRTQNGKIKKGISKLQMYSIGICFLVILNCLRSASFYTGHNELDHKLFFKSTMSIWWMECSFKAVTFFVACISVDKMRGLFIAIDDVLQEAVIDKYRKKLAKQVKVQTIKIWMLAIINIGGTVYCVFGPHELSDLFNLSLAPLPVDFPYLVPFQILNVFMHCINVMVALFPLGFYTTICFLLYYEFKELHENFAKDISKSGEISKNLEDIRLRHQSLSKCVEKADAIFSYYIAVIYTTNLPLSCVVLYNMIYHQLHISQTLLNCFWCVSVLVQSASVSMMGAIVNAQAHAPLTDIYSIRVLSASNEHQLQISMFLHKLTGSSIGLTALDMFVINRPTILTQTVFSPTPLSMISPKQ
ncbi:unnamed protein product [Owenia fusiformis]|uniref:Uncharacterized protein n=1 Tax=Owenia fusiformis TaxID=6347 RepID=A0A8J1XVB8_OWEFU|nr:unnamed protein product [Owenia fusiformis]